MNLHVVPAQLLFSVGALASLSVFWRISAWKRRRTLERARGEGRLLSLFGRVLFTAVLIVAVQWIVITVAVNNHGLVLAVLGIPALFAALTLTRALTVTTMDTRRVRGGRR